MTVYEFVIGLFMIVVLAIIFIIPEKKKQNCLHTHSGGVVIEFCGPNVQCNLFEDGEKRTKVCVFVPDGALSEKK